MHAYTTDTSINLWWRNLKFTPYLALGIQAAESQYKSLQKGNHKSMHLHQRFKMIKSTEMKTLIIKKYSVPISDLNSIKLNRS